MTAIPVMVARHGRSSPGAGTAGSISRARSRGEPLRLAWPGRTWEPGARSEAAPRISTVELTAPAAERAGDPAYRLVLGDSLDVAGALLDEGLAGRVDAVYVDPPFASQSAYVYEARLDGPADGRVVRTQAYDDRWEGDGIGGYLDMLAPRLEALCRLLAPRGTIWVHLDYRASYLVRVLLEEILGRRAFVNEIVWRRAPNLGRQAASRQFGRTLDTILVYGGGERADLSLPTRLEPIDPRAIRHDDEGRPFIAAPRGDYTDESIERLEKVGRVHRAASGKVYVKYFLVQDADGAWCRERRVDALWTDVAPLRHAAPAERTGFPTQKPRALLDRIVSCASPPGGLVVDLFAGSGTVGESAHALGRRFVLGDSSPLAHAAARARLARSGVPMAVQQCGSSPPPGAAVRVETERSGHGACVRLIAPHEPVAWAVGVAEAGLMRDVWHSERAPGARARPAALEAVVDDAPGPLAVRVWGDDGHVSDGVAEVR